MPVVCVQLIEHLKNLVIVLTSGTCGTAALVTPLKVVEASCIEASLLLGTIFTFSFFCDFLVGVSFLFDV